MILWCWQYFQKIRTAGIKGTFFRRFDIAVDAEPWELKNTLMCQLWHVGRLRVNREPTWEFVDYNLLEII